MSEWSRADLRRGGLAVAFAAAAWGCGDEGVGPREAPACSDARPACRRPFTVVPGRSVPVYATHDLDGVHPEIDRVLVIIHGTDRNADDYFETGVAAAVAAGVDAGTLVLAPRFRTADDDPPPGDPRWTSGGWKRGHLSVDDGRTPVSSYEVLDALLAAATDPGRFPGVAEVVVAGHSAGGQVVHRFAARSALAAIPGGVAVRFVVANPSTYLIPTPRRWIDGGLSVPDGSACPDYDRWHYGFQDRNRYMERVSIDEASARLLGRDVRVLLGAADTLDASLDVSCGAMLQGRHRLERGRRLLALLDALGLQHHHRLAEVPGVGHSSRSMFTSPRGLEGLFR